MRIAFLEPVAPPADRLAPDILRDHDLLIPAQRGQLPAGYQTADVVLWSNHAVDAAFIDSLPNLKLMQRVGFFRHKGDARPAVQKGIPVSVLPHGTSGRVAEHTLALILGLFRGLLTSHAAVLDSRNPGNLYPEVRNSATPSVNWAQVPNLRSLRFATVGILAFGEIGAVLAQMLAPFGCRVLYYKRTRLTPQQEAFYGVTYASLDEVLTQSDAVVNYIPASEATKGMLGEREFGLMKQSAYFINTGRAYSTDEAALLQALNDYRIAGAGLDVFWLEPLPGDHPIKRAANTLLTPHTAGGTPQGVVNGWAGWTDILTWLNENIRRVQAGEPVMSPLRLDQPLPTE